MRGPLWGRKRRLLPAFAYAAGGKMIPLAFLLSSLQLPRERMAGAAVAGFLLLLLLLCSLFQLRQFSACFPFSAFFFTAITILIVIIERHGQLSFSRSFFSIRPFVLRLLPYYFYSEHDVRMARGKPMEWKEKKPHNIIFIIMRPFPSLLFLRRSKHKSWD